MFRNPTADLIVVLLIVLLIFGPKRLPGLGKQLGQGLREFKDSITGDSKVSDEPDRPALEAARPAPAAPAAHAQPDAAHAQPDAAHAQPDAAAAPEAAHAQQERRESAEIGSDSKP